jgi:hypothetical protein
MTDQAPVATMHVSARQPSPAGHNVVRQQQPSSSTISIPNSAPAGGLTITQPPQTATSFYKIAPSQFITFAWNFTDLIVTPTSLTISAVGQNKNTYPVGPTNGIIPGSATSVVWDPWSYNQNSGNQVSFGAFCFYLYTFRRSPLLLLHSHSINFITPLPSFSYILFIRN